MADLRDFYFYSKYLWRAQDFTDLQTYVKDTIKAVSQGAFGAAVLQGLKVTAAGSMTVSVPTGIAVNSTGRLMVIDSTTVKSVASPVGNPARTLIVARPVDTDFSYIAQPTAPANMVPLYKKLVWQIVVIDGTPGASPSYPSAGANDVVLAGLKLNAGHTTISASDFDRSVINLPRKRIRAFSAKTASFSVVVGEEVYDVDATSGAITSTLPPASDAAGETFTVIKIDSSANAVSVSGSETISGQNPITLDSQWDTAKVFSNGASWRLV